MNIEKDLKIFIVTKLMHEKDSNILGDDESLFKTSIIDSLGFLKLVTFLKEGFNVHVEDEELIPDNFETINILKDYIERKLVSNEKKLKNK